MNYKSYLIIVCLSLLFTQDNPCSLPTNTILLSNNDVWYNTDFNIGGFQWDVDGTTVVSASGGDSEEAGFTVQSAGQTLLGFSFTGSYVPQGCGILTTMILNGESSGLSEIVFSNDTGQAMNVDYYCDDIDNDGICFDFDNCPYDLLNDADNSSNIKEILWLTPFIGF